MSYSRPQIAPIMGRRLETVMQAVGKLSEAGKPAVGKHKIHGA